VYQVEEAGGEGGMGDSTGNNWIANFTSAEKNHLEALWSCHTRVIRQAEGITVGVGIGNLFPALTRSKYLMSGWLSSTSVFTFPFLFSFLQKRFACLSLRWQDSCKVLEELPVERLYQKALVLFDDHLPGTPKAAACFVPVGFLPCGCSWR
jgi:hypothetical protein